MYKRSSKTKQPDSAEHGFNYAMFLLNLRLRSEGEIRFKMSERGYENKIIESVIEKLYEYKYLDDNRFAEILIENFKLYKNYGSFMIKKKLMEKRLPNKLIEQKLEQLYDSDQETIVALRWLKKEKLPTETQEQRQKVFRRLQSRGFRLDAIKAVVNKST